MHALFIVIVIVRTLHIFFACTLDKLPPKTVKSWLNTNVVLPKILPRPVITESPGNCTDATNIRMKDGYLLFAHAEIIAEMLGEHVVFDKRARIA